MRPALSYDALRQVVIEQQEEIAKIKRHSWIQRTILKDTKEVLEKTWIKVIVGCRRSGKSIFAHQLLRDKQYGYINFDDERYIGVSSADLSKILQYLTEYTPGVKILFFDEVQNIDGWEFFINRLQRQGYNVVITGSNSTLLSKELASHLTGRYVTIELSPFSFEEFLKGKEFDWTPTSLSKTKGRAALFTHLNNYLLQGGFPDMVLQGYDGDYLRELYDKIVSRDITYRYGVKNSRTLREIGVYSHANLGKPITYHKVKSTFEVSSINTVKTQFQYLLDGYLVFLLDPFSFKYKERVKQPRRVFTVDKGLSAAVNPKFSEDKDASLRNLVFQELHRRGKQFAYYSSVDTEIDFVLHTEKIVDGLIQVVWSLEDLTKRKREVKGLIKAATQLKCKDLTIITWDDEEIKEAAELPIKVIPAWKWLLQI